MIAHFRPGTDDDTVIRELLVDDMYRMKRLAARLAGRSGSVMDGGAHIGVATVMLARHFPAANITAYEPEPENFEYLERNVAAAEIAERVDCRRVALGESTGGRVPLWPPAKRRQTGQHSITPERPAGVPILVNTVSLEEEILRLSPVLLLKLDLEGAEAPLLNRLGVDALSRVTALIVETHHFPLDVGRLQREGFRCVRKPYGLARHMVLARD